jgi:hypothetical protein
MRPGHGLRRADEHVCRGAGARSLGRATPGTRSTATGVGAAAGNAAGADMPADPVRCGVLPGQLIASLTSGYRPVFGTTPIWL